MTSSKPLALHRTSSVCYDVVSVGVTEFCSWKITEPDRLSYCVIRIKETAAFCWFRSFPYLPSSQRIRVTFSSVRSSLIIKVNNTRKSNVSMVISNKFVESMVHTLINVGKYAEN